MAIMLLQSTAEIVRDTVLIGIAIVCFTVILLSILYLRSRHRTDDVKELERLLREKETECFINSVYKKVNKGE